jgi:hypothetical protein
MPLNTCRVHYQCPNCGAVLRGNGEIGCVFTAYGSVPCPFMQSEYAMFAWFDFLDRQLRQRAQLRILNAKSCMRRGGLRGCVVVWRLTVMPTGDTGIYVILRMFDGFRFSWTSA